MPIYRAYYLGNAQPSWLGYLYGSGNAKGDELKTVNVLLVARLFPRKHKSLTQCWSTVYDAGPALTESLKLVVNLCIAN